MRFAVATIVVTVLLMLPAAAQNERKEGWGYGFFGGGVTTEGSHSESLIHYGAGVEALLASGFGVGVEIGTMNWGGGFTDGIGVFSPGVVYAFNTDQKIIPFITGGYTLFFRDGTLNGAFFGGGANFLIGDRWGIRVEGRDQIWDFDDPFHNLEGRFGFIYSWQ